MSLLTQFYNCSSGGGTSGTFTSFPSIVVGGMTATLPTVANGTSGGSGGVFTSTSNGVFGSCSGGDYWYLTFNNTFVNGWTISTTQIKEIHLNGSTVGQLNNSGVACNSLTGIYGSGILSPCSLGASPAATCSALTTISTDIQLVPITPTAFRFDRCALDAASVNHILESLVENGATNITATLSISLGTSAGNSSLTAAGLAARNALVAAGWAVTLN